MEYYLYGGLYRFCEVVIYSSLWLVVGLMVAAIFRHMLGPAKVRKLFGEGTRRGIFTGWLIGMLLPVCSLGAIPIVRELHRSKVKGGTIIAFGLTAPLFNPMSVLYGLTLSDPIAILSFSLCALVIVSILGIMWDYCFPGSTTEEPDEKMPQPGIRRIAAVFHSVARDATGASMAFVAVGILCAVLIAISFPKGQLQHLVERDNAMAPVAVAAIALPIYSTPLLAMSQIGGMFQHGNSIGAAFSLLILGAGANIGLLAWFSVTYGFKRMLTFIAILAATTVGLAYAIDKPLYPKGVEPAGHTHAFDVYTHPFHRGERNLSELWQIKTADFWASNEFGSTYFLAGFIVLGIGFRIFNVVAPVSSKSSEGEQDSQYESRIDKWLHADLPPSDNKYDVIVPGWVLGGTSVAGLVAASVIGCYLYYPAPDDLLPDLSNINTEVVLSAKNQQWETAEKWIPFADDLSRRLEVGVYLREGSVDDFLSAKAKTYREKLDEVKELVEERNTDGLEKTAMSLSDTYRRMSAAFRGVEE